MFSVGAAQPSVTFVDVLDAGGVAGGVKVEVPPVVEPLPVELPPAGAVSATVVELVLVLLVADAAAPIPSSPPQPASAIARLPSKDAITTRPAPNPRSACLIKTPESDSNSGQARDEVTIRGCTSVQLWVQLA